MYIFVINCSNPFQSTVYLISLCKSITISFDMCLVLVNTLKNFGVHTLFGNALHN